MTNLKNRLPEFQSAILVYSVIVFLVYGWTLTIFLWKVPSWIKFLTVGELMVILAYSMSAALLESLFVLGLLCLVSLILPKAWLRDVFLTRGTVAGVFGLGTIMTYIYRFSVVGYGFISSLHLWVAVGLVVTILATIFCTRLRAVERAVAWFSDRVSVFLFILLPVSVLSLLVIIFRNL